MSKDLLFNTSELVPISEMLKCQPKCELLESMKTCNQIIFKRTKE
jgi:hypothetical protein